MTDPRPLALARIGIGLGALLTVLELFVALAKVASGHVAMPLFAWAPPVTDALVQIWLVLGILAALSLVAGAWSRVSAGAVSIYMLSALAWEQQTYSSHVVLLTVLTAILALGRPGERWSVDARVRPAQDRISAWPQFLMATQLSVLYLFAAASKINETFLSGDVLRDSMWLPVPEWAYSPMAVAAVATEFTVAFALWSRKTRTLAAGLGVALHLTITVTLNLPIVLLAFSLLSLSCYPLFWALSPSESRRHAHEVTRTTRPPARAEAAPPAHA